MRATYRIGLLAIITAFMSISVMMCVSAQSAPKKAMDSPIVSKCKADLAKKLNVIAGSITAIKAEPVTIPDSSLGMPERDKMYAQMINSGLRIILEAKNHQYLYMASSTSFKYGGPINIWAYSMLYTMPMKNDPNLNNDLYQCSFIGTNTVRLASGVSDYYPQSKGVILATQRTSRSGFDLLYIKADEPMKSKIIYSAFYIGEAVINENHSKWAAIVRSMVGSGWRVVFSEIDKAKGEKQMIPVPDDINPKQLGWSGEKLVLLGEKGGRPVCLEVSSKLAVPDNAAMWESAEIPWKEIGMNQFPGLVDYMLNKSESLEIEQMTKDNTPMPKYDTPYVEVAKVWFTGDRNVIAQIRDFKLAGYDFLGGEYAVVWGERKSKQVFYAVDIWSKEVINGYNGTGQDIKPFMYPAYRNPMSLKKK